jgi:hypothetical protein
MDDDNCLPPAIQFQQSQEVAQAEGNEGLSSIHYVVEVSPYNYHTVFSEIDYFLNLRTIRVNDMRVWTNPALETNTEGPQKIWIAYPVLDEYRDELNTYLESLPVSKPREFNFDKDSGRLFWCRCSIACGSECCASHIHYNNNELENEFLL